MSSFVVVLDACVLIPSRLRDTLLRAAEAGLFQLCWTDDILREVQRNLSEILAKKGLPTEGVQSLIDEMKRNFPDSIITHHTSLIESMLNHPKDRHVLAAAVASGARVIVTSNLKDFPQLVLAPLGLEAQSPDEFLTGLLGLAPDTMSQIIFSQAADLQKPPRTPTEVLDALAKQAPTFVTLVRRQLGL